MDCVLNGMLWYDPHGTVDCGEKRCIGIIPIHPFLPIVELDYQGENVLNGMLWDDPNSSHGTVG